MAIINRDNRFMDLIRVIKGSKLQPAYKNILLKYVLDVKAGRRNNDFIDDEFLELSEADREEMEIGLNVDKYTFIRGFKRVVRHLKYFYLEHRGICRAIIGIVGFIFGRKVCISL